MTHKTPYSVADVVRLTGLSRHVLHKWEQRYGVVRPHRTAGGHRVYTEAELERLRRLRRLTHAGHPIGRLATLDDGELAGLLEHLEAAPSRSPGHRGDEPTGLEALVAGPTLAALAAEEPDRVRRAGMHVRTVADAEAALATLRNPAPSGRTDVAVLEIPALSEARLPELESLRRDRSVRAFALVYRIGSREAVQRLQDAGVVCLRAPLSGRALAAQLDTFVARLTDSEPGLDRLEQDAAVTPNRFSARALARLTRLQPALRCECPNHIAQLLLDITAFEAYSLDCESIDPEERELHNFLRGVAASARTQFEAALERVLAQEDLSLDSLD